MKRVTVYIDESGTLPDPHDKVIVIAAVVPKNKEQLDKLISTMKKRKDSKRRPGELKFYTAGDKTKTVFFEALAQEQIALFALIVEKMGRKIPDTPEHFALLCWLLLSDVISFCNITDLIFDRHFFKKSDISRFNKILTKQFNIEFDITHVDSIRHKRVNVADMVAGAILAKETGKDEQSYKIIEKKIISYKKLNWVEAKRRLFQ